MNYKQALKEIEKRTTLFSYQIKALFPRLLSKDDITEEDIQEILEKDLSGINIFDINSLDLHRLLVKYGYYIKRASNRKYDAVFDANNSLAYTSETFDFGFSGNEYTGKVIVDRDNKSGLFNKTSLNEIINFLNELNINSYYTGGMLYYVHPFSKEDEVQLVEEVEYQYTNVDIGNLFFLLVKTLECQYDVDKIVAYHSLLSGYLEANDCTELNLCTMFNNYINILDFDEFCNHLKHKYKNGFGEDKPTNFYIVHTGDYINSYYIYDPTFRANDRMMSEEQMRAFYEKFVKE